MNEFLWSVRVYYEDTDRGGVVYHTNYLKFMERSRTEMLRSVGFEQDQLIEKENIIFVVRSLQVDYMKPATFNDLLQVSALISHVGHASLTFKQAIKREADDSLICQAQVKVACCHAQEMKPRPIPKTIRREFNYAD